MSEKAADTGQSADPGTPTPEADAPEAEVIETRDGPIEVYDDHYVIDQTEDESEPEGEGRAEFSEGDPDAEAAEEAPAEEEGETVAAGEAEGSTEGDEPGVTEEASDAEGTETEEQASAPFSFKTHGQEVTPPGAFTYQPPGQDEPVVVMPASAWQSHVQPRLASNEAMQAQRTEYEAKLRELSPDRNEEVIRAGAVVKELQDILSDETKLRQFLTNFEVNSAALRTRVENAVLQSQAQARVQDDEAMQHQQRTQGMASMMASDLPAVVDSMFGAVPEGVLTDEQKNSIRERLYDQADRYYVLAENEELARQHGLSVGHVGRLDDRLRADFVGLIRLAGAGRPAPAEKQDQVRRKNRAALGGKKPPDATTPSKPRVAAPATERKMTRETWNSMLRPGA